MNYLFRQKQDKEYNVEILKLASEYITCNSLSLYVIVLPGSFELDLEKTTKVAHNHMNEMSSVFYRAMFQCVMNYLSTSQNLLETHKKYNTSCMSYLSSPEEKFQTKKFRGKLTNDLKKRIAI